MNVECKYNRTECSPRYSGPNCTIDNYSTPLFYSFAAVYQLVLLSCCGFFVVWGFFGIVRKYHAGYQLTSLGNWTVYLIMVGQTVRFVLSFDPFHYYSDCLYEEALYVPLDYFSVTCFMSAVVLSSSVFIELIVTVKKLKKGHSFVKTKIVFIVVTIVLLVAFLGCIFINFFIDPALFFTAIAVVLVLVSIGYLVSGLIFWKDFEESTKGFATLIYCLKYHKINMLASTILLTASICTGVLYTFVVVPADSGYHIVIIFSSAVFRILEEVVSTSVYMISIGWLFSNERFSSSSKSTQAPSRGASIKKIEI